MLLYPDTWSLPFKKDLVNIGEHHKTMYYMIHQYHQHLQTMLHKEDKTPCFAYPKQHRNVLTNQKA